VYRHFGPADELQWVREWPEPELLPDSVLIRTAAGSVNPKDVMLRKGKFRALARSPLPRVSGLDAAGHIVAIGSELGGFAVGDPVFGMSNDFCGGVHAELARFRKNEFDHAPSNLSLTEAAAVPLAAQTALQALRDCCALQSGQSVLINGASGGVGHFAVQIAKVMGAQVHAVCGTGNVDFVRSLGADAVHSYATEPATAISRRFDAVFDVFGNYSRRAFTRQLGRGGVYVSTVPKARTLLAEGLARLGVSRVSRLVVVRSRSEDLATLRQWIEAGRVVPHIERTFDPNAAASAHRHVETKRTVGKVCIVFR
jgi:NADPH:quinone reductase-like Zn-dependent oxidoreductase